MKRKLFYCLIFLVPTVLLVSCDDDIQKSGVKQAVYFEYTYVNYAWKYTNVVYLIDSSGRVHTYNIEKDKSVGKVDTDRGQSDSYTSQQIEEMLSRSTLTSTIVSKSELSEQIDRLFSIKGNNYSPTIQIGADQGVAASFGYRYNPQDMTYTRILLKQKGDIASFNKDENAMELASWIENVVKNVVRATDF